MLRSCEPLSRWLDLLGTRHEVMPSFGAKARHAPRYYWSFLFVSLLKHFHVLKSYPLRELAIKENTFATYNHDSVISIKTHF